MAWTPTDETQFDTAYLSGLSDFELATLFNTSPDRVDHYLRSRKKSENPLPKRGTFIPKEVKASLEVTSNNFDALLLSRLKKTKEAIPITLLCDEFDCSPKRIVEAISRLQIDHALVNIVNGAALVSAPEVGGVKLLHGVDEYLNGENLVFGVVSDQHMGSKFARDDINEALYDIFEEEGINMVFNCGNWIEGEASFNKNELTVHGMNNQVHHFAKNYPKRTGITTYFIAGDDHEGWYVKREGIDIGKYAEMVARDEYKRDDLVYLGYMEHDVKFPTSEGQVTIRVMHPGGGSAYAISYQPQKIVESFTPGDKPNILLVGHYHKQLAMFLRGIHVVSVGCTQVQSSFMRKNRLSAALGGYIVRAKLAPDGSVLRFMPEFLSFYDSAPNWEYPMLNQKILDM